MQTSFSQLVISMGDPCGIGPEIICKALGGLSAAAQPLVIGDTARLALAAAVCKTAVPARIRELEGHDLAGVAWGQLDARAGAAAFAYIREAIALCRAGEFKGLVTAPIHKAALHAAGVDFPGHTEMLEHFSGARSSVAMMLANPELRCVLVSIHVSLREAIARVSVESVLAAIKHADQGARMLGIDAPRVAVAGLNPHAGEAGLFGDEELRFIGPAIAQARAQGIDASGPWPGDTVFMQARGPIHAGRAAARFDVVVGQYHDQALIPVKYMGLDLGVNITLGLPFVRTSPDHGTAFDIAGRGTASAASFEHALLLAQRCICA